jgi:polyribonucleotide nucleotidyltransferase
MTHGSALFQRGETQVVNVTTLGMPRMRQQLDTITPDEFRRYMHHYNFPPYSTGETGRVGAPKRREIGHGMLAERALVPVLPSEEDFAYTIRVVSDVLQSNGSTSMGSVCGSTLSLMAAGVPIKAPVAGIAMGLVYDEGTYVTLTDILGAEDAFGDMDFKVAGTADAVTALQLDTKIDGLPADVLERALHQAKEARLTILKVITDTIAQPRSEVAEVAPKIVSMEIPIDKIGEVIGPKGKVINTLQQETGADIAVDDDGVVGTVTIGAKDGRAVEEARRRISLILDPPSADVGAVYQGRVVSIAKFGAFINILPGRDGLLHISKLAPLNGGKRIGQVEDVLELGQALEVKVDDIDPQGKVSLSLVGDFPDVVDEPRSRERRPERDSRPDRGPRPDRDRPERDRPERDRPERDRPERASATAKSSSFEASFEAELAGEIGDLGPGGPAFSDGDGGGRRSPRPRRR